MLIPVRCFTCGKPIGDGKWKVYSDRVAKGDPPATVLNELGMRRYCCRRMYTSHYDAVGRLERYDLAFPDDELERDEKRKRSALAVRPDDPEDSSTVSKIRRACDKTLSAPTS